MKKIFRLIPLVYFIGLGVFWFLENYMGTGTINYIALAVVLVLLIELFYNHKIVGLVTGLLLGLFSTYMLFAVLSDVIKGGSINPNMVKFILFGGGLFGIGLLLAGLLVFYHGKQNFPENKRQTTSV
ncbi:hypothetical protein FMM05_12850 [Flavobacterium zepuense]|uniref:Uncharacterized protein n=1 Tax=Flavobacterium zepuense TaxID=2593302 RepID=A0A552UZ88_9FLAO|nr:hypothetical protein [Flavobacterium zepuense]TRW23544.1 hypothetical protein FMM05_12850 [Flavobacterium zepuense]